MRMAPKAFLLLGLLMAIVLLMEASARDLAEKTAEKTEETNGVYDAKYPDGPPEYGVHPPGREYGGGNPGEKPPSYIGGGRNCDYGCCSGSGSRSGSGVYHGGGCQRCCFYAGEKVDVETEVKPHN